MKIIGLALLLPIYVVVVMELCPQGMQPDEIGYADVPHAIEFLLDDLHIDLLLRLYVQPLHLVLLSWNFNAAA